MVFTEFMILLVKVRKTGKKPTSYQSAENAIYLI